MADGSHASQQTFRWDDPLDLSGRLTDDERMIRDTARAYAQDRLAPRIVDLVSSGRTLKENGLVEVEVICEVTSRLIVNRTALKTRPEAIGAMIARFRSALATLA